MINSTAYRSVFFLVLSLFLMLSCRKEESNTLSPKEEEEAAMTTAVAETEAEFVFNDVFDNVIGINNELGIPGAGIFGKFMNTGRLTNIDSTRCFTVSVSPQQFGIFPKTVTIDFGSGCTSFGRSRSGKIVTVYTGRLILPGSSATTTFHNYKIDNISVEGKHTVTNTGTLNIIQRQFEVTITEGKLTKTNGNYIIWNSKRTEKQVEGNATETPKDDIFSINGSAHGRVRNDNFIFTWNSEIIEPLVKKFTCNWISKGRIRMLRETLPSTSPWVSILDYGIGECDNKATMTVNGQTRQISLR